MAVAQVFGAELAWVADNEDAVGRWLDYRAPGVPNLGDVTKIDWASLRRVAIFCAGVPCQGWSNAGKRKGHEDSRWLWADIAEGIRTVRPRWVIIENVPGLLRGEWVDGPCECGVGAEFWGPGERNAICPACGRCVGGDAGEPVQRSGLGTILGTLAALGYLCSWTMLRASDVGAPHGRDRVFLVAVRVVEDAELVPGEQRGVAAVGEAAGGWASALAGGSGGAGSGPDAAAADAEDGRQPELAGGGDGRERGAAWPDGAGVGVGARVGAGAGGDARGGAEGTPGVLAGSAAADAEDDGPGFHGAPVAVDADRVTRPGPGPDGGGAAADPASPVGGRFGSSRCGPRGEGVSAQSGNRSGQAAADGGGRGAEPGQDRWRRRGGVRVAGRDEEPAAVPDAERGGPQRRGDTRVVGGAAGAAAGEGLQRERPGHAAADRGAGAGPAADPDERGRGPDQPVLPAGQPDAGRGAPPDPDAGRPGRGRGGSAGPGGGGELVDGGGRAAGAADPDRAAGQGAGHVVRGPGAVGRPGAGRWGRDAEHAGGGAAGGAAADPAAGGRDLRDTEPEGLLGGSDAGPGGAVAGVAAGDAATDPAGGDGGAAADAGRGGRAGRAPDEERGPGRRGTAAEAGPVSVGGPEAGAARIDWQQYGPAVARWEDVTGQRAPHPVRPSKLTKKRLRDCAADTGLDGWAAAEMIRRGWWGAQLDPAFVEWLMGVAPGWVTAVPGLSRNDQLKLLGNGVVPLQAIEGVWACLEELVAALAELRAAA